MAKSKKKIRLFPATRIKNIESQLANTLKPILKGMINDVIEYLEPFARAEREEEKLRKKAFREAKEAFYEPDVDEIISEKKGQILRIVTRASLRAANVAAIFQASKLDVPFDKNFYNSLIAPVIADRKFKIVTTVITANLEKELKAGIRKMLIKGTSASDAIKHFKGLKTNYRTIARTETLSAANQAGWMMADKELDAIGVKPQMQKTWNISGINTRDSHLFTSGQTVPFNEFFTLGSGAQAMYPQDPNLAAADFINCQCFVTYAPKAA